jgi:endonuclease/exonuclease/phosphatase family metal-dependent hydrolase
MVPADARIVTTTPDLDWERLAAASRMTAVPGWTMFRKDCHYGNALLTRREIRAVRRHDLSFSGLEPRGALHVELDVAGHSAHVLVTHLGLLSSKRRRQVDQLLAIVRSIPSRRP